jgi:branched-chain amino acid transport system permease protein
MNEELAFLLQLLIGGLSVGSIYALVALGFVLIFKTTKTLNFAQGELMMMGAYFCFTGVVYFKLPFVASVAAALLFMAGLGFVINMVVIRPMIGKPIFSIVMVTIGLAIIFGHAVGMVYGHLELKFPSPFSIDQTVSFAGMHVSTVHLWTIGVSMFFLVLFSIFFKYTSLGLGMKATANEQTGSMLLGVNINWMFGLSWVIAAVTATVAGIFLASSSFLHADMGVIGLAALPAIILGGMDSVAGAIIGGITIGILGNLAGGYLDEALGGGVKEITPYVIVILVMMVRPYGLFGKKHIERV